jgi:lipopolysaccharide/colanic/teichoic acid biosynthesis glycosyltransferase
MYEFLKRVMDIILALVLMVTFLPVCLLTILAITFDSSGPIFADTPERIGKSGKRFKMYKFRSMVQNAHEMLRFDPQFAKLYQKYKRGSYKLRDDPRITTVGRFIRKHSIDEIPQLINVLKGEMSIVGPRAYYPDELREQQEKYPHTKNLVKIVLSVRPGITGAWQVSGRSEVNFDKRIEIDADYVGRKSILYDMIILLRTPWAMVSGKGAL